MRAYWVLFTLNLNVLSRFGINVPFAESEVDYMNLILLLTNANQEVIWLDISMNQPFLMQTLHECDTLQTYQGNCPLWERSLAVHMKRLKARPQHVRHHQVVVTLCTKEVHFGNPWWALQQLVQAVLVLHAWCLRRNQFHFNCYLFVAFDVECLVYFSKRSTTYLFD